MIMIDENNPTETDRQKDVAGRMVLLFFLMIILALASMIVFQFL